MLTRRILLGGCLTGAALAMTSARGFAQVAGQLAAPEAEPHPNETFGDRMTGDLSPAHDPCIIKQGDTYYVFGSDALGGEGEHHIPWKTSKDLINWTARGDLFTSLPPWAQQAVPGTKAMWAPDISFINGRYHLYYAMSTFGGNRSAIGLYTNATLDPADPTYAWKEEGLVFASVESDDYNCIDPAHFVDREGNRWLVFGSFWGGIKMIALDRATGRPKADRKVYSLIHRPAPEHAPDAVEAPFMIERDGWYYLFASFDYCCKGENSSYYVVVGRSRKVTGPYVGRDGKSMMDGYGTQLIHGDSRWRGPGHEAVLRDGDRDYLVYHTYDATKHGASTLRISPITWTPDGWPTVTL
ncbi:MAG: arabinan endo-1,5-alpha-L-arabinosidase [Azospirillaceae bacterium]|nr:arabinan endo-1,5-alpha-L-arabinosidase [Azospirillaceae bacterium]